MRPLDSKTQLAIAHDSRLGFYSRRFRTNGGGDKGEIGE